MARVREGSFALLPLRSCLCRHPGSGDGTAIRILAVTALQKQLSAIGGQLPGTSNSVLDLASTVGNFSASVQFRVQTLATPTGALARIGLSVAATANGATSAAAICHVALSGGLSRILFEASQFIMVAGGFQQPFVVDGIAVRMNVANIGIVNARIIQSQATRW